MMVDEAAWQDALADAGLDYLDEHETSDEFRDGAEWAKTWLRECVGDEAQQQSDPWPEREALGRYLRDVWLTWAAVQPHPRRSWLTSWEKMPERHREVDRLMAEALYDAGRRDELERCQAEKVQAIGRSATLRRSMASQSRRSE